MRSLMMPMIRVIKKLEHVRNLKNKTTNKVIDLIIDIKKL